MKRMLLIFLVLLCAVSIGLSSVSAVDSAISDADDGMSLNDNADKLISNDYSTNDLTFETGSAVSHDASDYGSDSLNYDSESVSNGTVESQDIGADEFKKNNGKTVGESILKDGKTYTVSDMDDLAETIDGASDGDTIIIQGTYESDSKITLNKNLTFIGQNMFGQDPQLARDGNFNLFEITTENTVTFKNLLFYSGGAYTNPFINVNGPATVNFEDCNFKGSVLQQTYGFMRFMSDSVINMNNVNFTGFTQSQNGATFKILNVLGNSVVSINNSKFSDMSLGTLRAIIQIGSTTATLNVENTEFSEISGNMYGVIDATGGALSIKDSKFENNAITGSSRVVSLSSTTATSGSGIINGSTFINNDARTNIYSGAEPLSVEYSIILPKAGQNAIEAKDANVNINANYNYYGSNSNPISLLPNVTVSNWVIANLNATVPSDLKSGDKFDIELDFNHYLKSDSETTTYLLENHIPEMEIQSAPVNGAVSPSKLQTVNGSAKFEYTAASADDTIIFISGNPVATLTLGEGAKYSDIYVSSTGSDDADGMTEFNPIATIDKAINLANTKGTANVTIHVADGSYDFSGIDSLTNNVSIVGQTKGKVVLNYNGTADDIISITENILKLNNLKLTSSVNAKITASGNSVFIVENSIFEDLIENPETFDEDALFSLESSSSFVNSSIINCSPLNLLFYALNMDMINVNISKSAPSVVINVASNGKVNLNNVKISNSSATENIIKIRQGELIADKLSILDSSVSSDSVGFIYINHMSSVVNINNSIIKDNNLTNLFRVANSGAKLTVSNSELYDNNALNGEVVYINARDGAIVDADYNWWGSNDDPNAKVTGASIDKWIVMNITTDLPEGNLTAGDKVSITADFNHYATKGSETISDYDFKVNDLAVSAASEKGSLDKATVVTSNGIAKFVYTAVSSGEDSINVSSADQLLVIPVTVNELFTDIYVKPDGNDSNNGLSNENALASISRAAQIASSPAAASEVTIHIANGEYLEKDIIVGANHTIKFVGEEKDKVTVLVNGSSTSSGISGNTSQNTNIYSYDISFENLQFKPAAGSKSYALLYFTVSQAKLNIELINCTLSDYSAYYAGIYASSSTAGSSLTLIDCSVSNLTSTASNAYGGLIYLGSQVKLDVNHSSFHDNKVTGISSNLINNAYCNQGLSINYSSFYNNDIATGRLMQSGKTLDANCNYYGSNDNPSAFTTLSENNWVIMTSSNNLSDAGLNPGESVNITLEFNILTDSTGTNSTLEGEVAPILVKFEANHGTLSQSEVLTENGRASILYTLDSNERYEVLANSNLVLGRFIDYTTTISPTNINYYIKGDSVVITIKNEFNSSYDLSETLFYAFVGEKQIAIPNVMASNETISFNLASISENLTEGLNVISFHPLVSDLQGLNIRDWNFDEANLTVNVLNSKITDIYVSPDGDNSNSGLSEDTALKTIAAALDLSKSNYAAVDITIHLANGVYTENLGGSGNSLRLAPRKNTAVVGAEKGKVILLATGVLQPNYGNMLYMNRYFSVTEMNSIANLTFENLSFVNFTSSGATGGIINTNGKTNVDFINCTFENVNAGMPFNVAGNAKFVDSSFINVTPTSSLSSPQSTASMFWSNNAASITISSCEIRGSTFNGTKALLGSQKGTPTFVIENSAIYDNVIVEGTVLATSSNTFILNNNYWGTNENPSEIVGKTVDTWVIMSVSPENGGSLRIGETVDLTIDFKHTNSTDGTVSELSGKLPEILVKFSSIKGSLNVDEAYTEDGLAKVTYTALADGEDNVTVKSGNIEIIVPLTVTKDVDLSVDVDDENNVIVVLKDTEGNPINGASIKYTANDVSGNIVTENGTAIIPDLEGKVNLKLEFADENGVYTPTNISAMVVVVKNTKELTDLVEELNKTVNELNQTVADKDTEIANLTEALANKTAEVDALKEALANKTAELDALKENVTALEGDVAAKDIEIANLTEALANKTAELNELNESIASKNAEIDALNDNITALKDEITAKESEIDALNSNLTDKDNTIANQTKAIDDLTAQVNNLSSAVESKDKEISDLNNQIKGLDETVANQSALIDAQKAEIGALNETVANQTAKLDSLAAMIDSLNKTIENQAKTIEDLKETIKELPVVSNCSFDIVGDENIIIAILLDENGKPISGAVVELDVNGVKSNKTTDKNGAIEIPTDKAASITLTYTEKNGAKLITSTNVISQTVIVYQNQTIEVPVYINVTPNRASTKIIYSNMTTKSISLALDGRVGENFTFKLHDANGKPLANKTVFVGFNGHVYEYNTTEDGQASVQINLGKKGGYTFAIAFLGDDEYNGTFEAAKITVETQTPQLTTTSKTYKASAKTKTLSATFKTAQGSPVKGKKISFTVNGKTYTGTSNANGVASVKVSLNKKGTYSFTAKFAGDDMFGSISKKASLKIS